MQTKAYKEPKKKEDGSMKEEELLEKARKVVDRQFSFSKDKNKNVSGFREKMLEAIRQADITVMRNALKECESDEDGKKEI